MDPPWEPLTLVPGPGDIDIITYGDSDIFRYHRDPDMGPSLQIDKFPILEFRYGIFCRVHTHSTIFPTVLHGIWEGDFSGGGWARVPPPLSLATPLLGAREQGRTERKIPFDHRIWWAPLSSAECKYVLR